MEPVSTSANQRTLRVSPWNVAHEGRYCDQERRKREAVTGDVGTIAIGRAQRRRGSDAEVEAVADVCEGASTLRENELPEPAVRMVRSLARRRDMWLSTQPLLPSGEEFRHILTITPPVPRRHGFEAPCEERSREGRVRRWEREARKEVLDLLAAFRAEPFRLPNGPALSEEDEAALVAKAEVFSAWSNTVSGIEYHDTLAADVPAIARGGVVDREHTVCNERSRYAPLTEAALHRLRMWFPHLASPVKGCAACSGCRTVVACRAHEQNITGEVLNRLRVPRESTNEQWLNDELVNGYLGLIEERSVRFEGLHVCKPKVRSLSTFFYEKLAQGKEENGLNFAIVRNWTKRWDPHYLDIVFIPINTNNKSHWALVALYVRQRRLEYLDSFHGAGQVYLDDIRKWCCEYYRSSFGRTFTEKDFTTDHRRDLGRQTNTDDCGVFVCKYADFLALRHPINFTQAHMAYFRARMAHELLVSYVV